MGRLIEQQAVMDCLTNTAKYYDREDADEWTRGIHYGLLQGADNILDNVPTVEAIPKADYDARLKADMLAILDKIKDEIEARLCDVVSDYTDGYRTAIQGDLNILDKYSQKVRMKKKFISPEEAIALLPAGDTVHTFYNAPFGLLGADWDREDIIEKLTRADSIIELTGEAARSLDHGICVYVKGCKNQSDVLFIKTDPEKLEKFDPQ